MSRPAGRRFLLMSVVDAVGTGAFLPVSAVVLAVLVGVPPLQVGLVLTLATVLGLGCGPAAAPLVRRCGPSAVVRGSLLVRAGCLLGYLGMRGLAVAILLTAVGRVAAQLSRPAVVLLAAGGTGSPVRLLAAARAWRNVAMSVGSAGAGLALLGGDRRDYLLVVGINAASYLAAALLVPRVGTPAAPAAGPAAGGAPVPVRRDRRFLRCAAAAALLSLQATLLTVGLPLWLLVRAEAGSSLAAVALTGNMVLVAVLQVRVGRAADDVAGALRLLRRSGLLLAAGCLAPPTLAAGVPVWAIVAWLTVLVSAGEMAGSAGAWGASLGLAPAAAEQHLSVFAWAESAGEAVSAAVVTALVLGTGLGWVALAGLFVAAAVLVPAAAVRDVRAAA